MANFFVALESRQRAAARALSVPAWPDWLPLVLLAAFLRLINLGLERLWYDETFTAYLTRLDLAHVWAAILGDNHPPTWYLLEWLWARVFGASEFAMRLPSALLGILAVYLMWRVANALSFSRRAAFVSGLLLAVLPSALYYSQEARMYALMLVGVLLMLDNALRMNWGLFILGGVITVYSHNVGVIYVLMIGLSVLYRRGRSFLYWSRLPVPVMAVWSRRFLLEALLSLSTIVLAWLPWAIVGLSAQLKQVHDGFWLPPLQVGDVFFPFLSMGVGTRMTDSLQFVAYAGWACLVIAGLVASRHWLRTGDGLFFLSLSILTPIAAVMFSLLWRNVYVARTMLPAVALLVLPISYALVHSSGQNRRVLALVAVPVLLIGLVAHYAPDKNRGRGIADTWLKPLESGWQPGDVIYHLAVDSAIGTAYYAPAHPFAVLPESTNLGQSLTDATKTAMGFPQIAFDNLIRLTNYRRAWLIVNVSPMVSQRELDVWHDILARYPAILVNHEAPQPGFAESFMYLIPLGEVF